MDNTIQSSGSSRRIARRFVFYIVLVSSAITLVATAIQLMLDYQRDLTVIENNIKQIEKSHLQSLSNSVWVEDQQQIMSQLEGLVRYSDMEYLSISLDNKIIWSAGELESNRTLEKNFPLEHVYRDKRINIGNLYVVASIDSVISRLIDKAIVILVSNALKTFIVAGFIFLFFHFLVARHLYKLSEWARSHNIRDGFTPIKLNRAPHKDDNMLDEFDLVTGAMNVMQKSIVDAYESLQSSHESKSAQLQTVISNAPLILWAYDSSGVFTLSEGSGLKSLKLDPGQVVGQSVFELYADYPEIIGAAKRVLSGEEFVQESIVDGLYYETYYTPYLSERGDVLGCIGVSVDITDRKEAEQEIIRARDETTRANKELKVSNKELEAYSYSIAHDLRAPLRSIVGFSQIIIEDANDKLDSDNKEHLQRVVKAATHMSELIDDILELSRVSRSDMRLQKVDLSAICTDLSDIFNVQDTKRVVEWRIQKDIVVNGDRHLLYLVLNNLLSNAWKFTQNKSQAVIEFGLLREANENVYYVRDNGVGFDMRYADNLFGLFQRIHQADGYEGTGIGLATVQRIINRHNGWVKAEGEKDKGATIYFSIPEIISKPEQENTENNRGISQ